MKVSDFFAIIGDADFSCLKVIYNNDDTIQKSCGQTKFKLRDFGKWQWGISNYGNWDFIVVEKDFDVFRKYSKISDLVNDSEVMNMEIIRIKSITLSNYEQISQGGHSWPHNASKIVISVQ